jgi:hypothetical protein
VQQTLQGLSLTDAVRGQGKLAAGVLAGLQRNPEIAALGVEILGVSILAVKPSAEIKVVKALEIRIQRGRVLA